MAVELKPRKGIKSFRSTVDKEGEVFETIITRTKEDADSALKVLITKHITHR